MRVPPVAGFGLYPELSKKAGGISPFDHCPLEIIGGVKRRDRNEKNVFTRPNGLRENAENAISCRGPGPARKKKRVYHTRIPIVGWRRTKAHIGTLLAMQKEVEPTQWENMNCTSRNRMCDREG